MPKLFIAIFFASSFMTITVVPAVVMLFDGDSNLIQLYDPIEEEESKVDKKFENELILMQDSKSLDPINFTLISKIYLSDIQYSCPNIGLILPPPEML